MTKLISCRGLEYLLRKKMKKEEGIREISTRTFTFFIKYLNNLIEEITDEAVKGNYYRLMPIDIERGIRKFENRIVQERTGKTFEVIKRLLQIE